MSITRILAFFSLWVSTTIHADVLISLEATLVRPACIITNENGDKEFYINFPNVSLERLTENKASFGILIKQCELNKNLQIYLSPKEGSTININNETVLSTTTKGLGIRISEENKSRPIDLLKWQQIYPQVIGNTGHITLQSQLVTNQLPESLEAGPFSAALSVMIDYL